MKVLLGSGGVATPERLDLFKSLVSDHFKKSKNVVYIPLASANHFVGIERIREIMGDQGWKFNLLNEGKERRQIEEADGIYIAGGNSFLLVKELHRIGIIQQIQDAVGAGVPYLGVSAGSNVACPTMMTTNDMPIVRPDSYDSLGIVPFQINPHYYPGKIFFKYQGEEHPHFGESRRQRILEYHRIHDTPVLGMWEGSYVRWDGAAGTLIGRAAGFYPDGQILDFYDGVIFNGRLQILESAP